MSQEKVTVDSDVEATVSSNEVQATEKIPFPATICFPAIPRLSQIFHESTDRLNLTFTIFLVPQAACPMLWGPFSDRYGRRPCIILCFVVLILSCAGLSLTPTNAFWLLLPLRYIQSAGCTGTLALGPTVVHFLCIQRGTYACPRHRTVFGGLLSQYLGWRCISDIVYRFLPETLPCIVGNESIRPSFIYRALIPVVGKDRIAKNFQPVYKPLPKPFRNPFLLFLNSNVLVATLFTSVIFSMQYNISGTLSNAANIGLCYLPNGQGLEGGTIINGKLLDAEYRRTSRARAIREAAEKGISEEHAVSRANFPIERARLQTTPFMVLLFSGSVSLAGPLLLQILRRVVGFSSICVLNATTTLMIDLFPD
ncbi:major facilitator superfamily domain-containing protein [Armillaria luteobubalina]|uniref:Major facilitator superfamily domain-containing protein n=1 Tax=Armillaria luteobubalina TaxID=153913 RepID=A0AA39UUP4_9AGAR|nr:major facilitator superfamily domain-containing protein [Armillaria luteobubalina]